MIDFLLQPGNMPFVVALGLMFTFTVIEILSTAFGMGLSEMFDSFLPEMDADLDLELDGPADGSATGSLVKLLAWFRVGEVPVVMLFIVFLTGFGMSGLLVQYGVRAVTGHTLPTMLAVAMACFAAIPTVRFCGGLLGKYMPKDETYVVSEKSFHGMIATVTLGTARKGKPAQAKIRDRHGQTHYLMVEPDNATDQFAPGQKTIIVGQVGAIYQIIEASAKALNDE